MMKNEDCFEIIKSNKIASKCKSVLSIYCTAHKIQTKAINHNII